MSKRGKEVNGNFFLQNRCLFIEFFLNSNWLVHCHSHTRGQSQLATCQPILTAWGAVFWLPTLCRCLTNEILFPCLTNERQSVREMDNERQRVREVDNETILIWAKSWRRAGIAQFRHFITNSNLFSLSMQRKICPGAIWSVWGVWEQTWSLNSNFPTLIAIDASDRFRVICEGNGKFRWHLALCVDWISLNWILVYGYKPTTERLQSCNSQAFVLSCACHYY
jgi:hypothetical protein